MRVSVDVSAQDLKMRRNSNLQSQMTTLLWSSLCPSISPIVDDYGQKIVHRLLTIRWQTLEVWMSLFCLAWLLPQTFIAMTTVLGSLGLHHGETGVCADSRGRRKTNQPMENYGNQDTALKGMNVTIKKTSRSKAALTPGIINSMDQIQTQEKREVPPLRPSLNLAMILELLGSKYKLFSHPWANTTVFVTFTIALDPAFHSAAVLQARFLGMGPKTRGR